MFNIKKLKIASLVSSACLLTAVAANSQAATATFDPSTSTVDLSVVQVLNGASSEFYNAQLKLLPNGSELELVGANVLSATTGQRNVFDPATNAVHISSIDVNGEEYYAKLKLVPGSSPMRFTLDQFVKNSFESCPAFSTVGPTAGSCVLSGEILQDVTLTKNIQWILSGGVFVGGDKTNNVTLTINPGTKIFGQQGADFLWIRRGSKIMSEGTPDNPVVMSGAAQQSAGEWGGLIVSGNAPVNGCNEGVAVCEIPNEAITSEFFGGNNPADNSGVIKYTQILFAGFAVRPDEELNGLTLNAVGSGTLVDYVHVHAGLDDGVEMFGGTVQMKHIVLTDISDDSLDWGLGWRGNAQYVLIKQASDDGDRGIEADNNKSGDLQPRSKPVLSNMTIIGSAAGSQGALLRRGTGANISNTVITGFPTCLTIDGEATYRNTGIIGNLTGELTINNSFVNCETNFKDGDGASPNFIAVSGWFTTQPGNKAEDPMLDGFLPQAGSPLLTGGAAVNNPFFDAVDYVGAFKDADDNWTQEWTFKLN